MLRSMNWLHDRNLRGSDDATTHGVLEHELLRDRKRAAGTLQILSACAMHRAGLAGQPETCVPLVWLLTKDT